MPTFSVHLLEVPQALCLELEQQLVALLKKCDLVVTVDNFIMHAAYLAGTPAVVVWGPTHPEVYGYPGQSHLQTEISCGYEDDLSCIASEENREGNLYVTECTMGGNGHCMNKMTPELLYKACKEII